jgi:membrane fusion protein (multidrug efflux system)
MNLHQWLSGLLLLSASSCLSLAAEPSPIPTTNPSTGTILRWISLPATLAPWQQAALHAKVTGYVKSISVDQGDSVKSGQLLALIEVPELEADLAAHKAEVSAAQSESDRLLAARKKSPDLTLPQSIDNAKARLALAQSSLARSETLLRFAEIRAPFDGIISSRMVDQGALVSAGSTQMFHLVDSSTIRLQIPITELETPLVHKGIPVKATISALPSQPLDASISRTAHSLDPATRTMLAQADLPNPTLSLRPGMFATARIGVEKHDNATLIPVAGLVMEKSNAFVFRLINGKAVKTAVTPGFNDGTHAEIPSLKPDDVILLPGTTLLTDGQPIPASRP